MTGHRVLLVDPPDIDAVWTWLEQQGIEPLETAVTDVSDVTLSSDVIMEVVLATEEQATLFMMAWGNG